MELKDLQEKKYSYSIESTTLLYLSRLTATPKVFSKKRHCFYIVKHLLDKMQSVGFRNLFGFKVRRIIFTSIFKSKICSFLQGLNPSQCPVINY